MRKMSWLLLGVVLLGSGAQAEAQKTTVTTRVHSGYLGIRYDEDRIIVNGQENPAKVIVKEVSKDSPAEKAGIRAGDEILRINGLAVANGKFSAVARTLVEGDTVRLRVKRGNQERDYAVVAGPRPAGYHTMMGDRTIIISADSIRERMKVYLDSARVHLDAMNFPRVWVEPGDSSFNIRIERFGGMPGDTLIFNRDTSALRKMRERIATIPPGETFRRFEGELGPGVIFHSMELGSRAIAGAEFTELDPAMKTYFGTDRGLLTLRVAPETPAARAGLLPGDVVVKADNRAVSSVPELRRMLFEQPETLKIEVLRKGESKTLQLQTRRKGSDD